MTHPIDGDLECWWPPQSPFQILYSRLVFEQIRLAVVDAYFLVPRGGLEIGGVLLGKYRDRRIEVIDHEPMECEHAFGPSFSLSPRDEERLKDVLAQVRNRSGGLEPVGWYHSHTRSELCLTESDLDIHHRYFPEMWQIALVVRPSTSQPARAGFFFRELGGSIRASASYHEFKLEPLRGGPALLKAQMEARALPAPQSRPEPAIERNPRPPQERPTPPTANSRPPLEDALTSTAVPKPPRERPAPVTRALTPVAQSRPPRERPAPLTAQRQPAPERQPAPSESSRPILDLTPTVVGKPAQEGPAAPPVDLQPKPVRLVTPRADPAPPPKRPAAIGPSPQPVVVATPARQVDSAPQVIELPRFLRSEPPPRAQRTRAPLFITGMICLAVALGGFAYVTRDAVLRSIRRIARDVSAPPGGGPSRIGPAMSINAIDDLGQLQIRWDTSSPAVQEARSAVLAIVDGGPPQRIPLDGPHLEAGVFTYKRHGARVDARLTILTSEGSSLEAATTFLGPPAPAELEPVPAVGSAAVLAKQNAQLRRQLDEQIVRNKTLQAQLDRLRKQRAARQASGSVNLRGAPADRP